MLGLTSSQASTSAFKMKKANQKIYFDDVMEDKAE